MMDDVPERVLEKPESVNEDFLPEIAEKLGITVSMLRSQPDDVQQMIRTIYLQTQHDDAAFADRMKQVMRVEYVSPTKDWELAQEMNGDHIDGIINNLPLKREADEEEPEISGPEQRTAIFTFSRKRLRELAAAARVTAAQNARSAKQTVQSREEQPEIARKEGGS